MYEITTPFLDNHNDHIQIYIKKSDSRLILTDNGQTITKYTNIYKKIR